MKAQAISTRVKAGSTIEQRFRNLMMKFLLALFMGFQLLALGCEWGLVNTMWAGNNYNCSITLQRGNERRTLTNDHALFEGMEERKFFTCPVGYDDHARYDLNGDGVRDQADAVLDWRRWVHYNLQRARESEDITVSEQWRGWCEVPDSARCVDVSGMWQDSPPDQEALPDVPMSVCSTVEERCINAAFSASEPGMGDPLENVTDLEWPVEEVCVGEESEQTLRLTNCDSETLYILGAGIPVAPQSADFQIVWNQCAPESEAGLLIDGALDPGSSCLLAVQFDPQAPGERHAAIVFNTTDPELENVEIQLTAQAVGGAINVPEAATFYEMSVGGCTHEARVCIANTGCGNLEISDLEIDNANFELVSDPTAAGDLILPPTGTGSGVCGGLELVIRYCENDPATLHENGILQITSDDTLYPTVEVRLMNPGS